ncbi:MAG: DUF1667 domain-containing protein [Firmicutes bacterium]|nr:DUF1667 domain-containing protein [Bacillota bacterium]
MNKEIICTTCPKGCHLNVDENLNVQGFGCTRGIAYGKAEATNPVRMLTSTVKLVSTKMVRLPVITSHEVPKGRMFDIMAAINKVTVRAPVHVGDVIIADVCHLGVNVVATRTIEE